MARKRSGISAALRRSGDGAVGMLTVGMLKLLRSIPRKPMARFAGRFLRTVGPLLREHRIGGDNLKAAYPGKSDAEIETILRGVWDNLGRVAAEFAHIDRLHIADPANPGPEDIIYTPRTLELFQRLRDDGKPALLFTSHLANWELAAYVAEQYGLHLHVLYRRPNIGAANDAIMKLRSGAMGTMVATGLDAPGRLAEVLKANGHVAMLVDQYYVRGVDIMFFGRKTRANPFLARLARHVDCPIHGARIVRLPGDKFRIDVTEEIPPVRNSSGAIDVERTTQAINDVIEGWVREHPEQWLWVHRKWRDD
jgi:KDO2-lipid IV(A) lauroyltransferase